MAERRQGPRRQGDVIAQVALHWANRLLIAWLVLLTVAIATGVAFQLGLTDTQDTLRDEALGLCRAINNGRNYVNDAHQQLHRVLLIQGRGQHATGKQLANGISSGVRAAASTQRQLGLATEEAARAIQLLPDLDCRALGRHPLRYRLPQQTPIR